MNASVMNGNFNGYVDFDKEEKHMDMIRTGRYKNYGQLVSQANETMDVETFVYHNGRIEPAIQAENSTTPDIWIDHESNYDQFEDQTNGTVDVEAFVFSNCMVVPASQA